MLIAFGHIGRWLELLPKIQLDILLLDWPVVRVALLVQLVEDVVGIGVTAMDFLIHGLINLLLLLLAIFFFDHGPVLLWKGSFAFERPELDLKHVARWGLFLLCNCACWRRFNRTRRQAVRLILLVDTAPVLTANAMWGALIDLWLVIAGALLRGAVVSRVILVLSQLVVVCLVQDSHYVLLSAVVRHEVSLFSGWSGPWNVVNLRLGRNYKGDVLHPGRAHEHSLILRISKFLPDSHLFTLGNLGPGLHVFDWF